MNRFLLLLTVFFAGCPVAMAQIPFGIKNRVTIKKTPQKILEYIQQKKNSGMPLKEYEQNFHTNVTTNNKQIETSNKTNAGNAALIASTNAPFIAGNEEEFQRYRKNFINEVEDADVAEKLSTGIVISDDVEKLFPTIVGNVVNYRLRLWSRIPDKGPDKDDTIVTYLPLSIVSKLSGNTGNNAGTVNDAASFFGAPFTLRFSPNLLDVDVDNKKGRFVIGMHHDLRMLAIADTATEKVEAGFGYYGAFGLSYFNIGQVFNDEAKDWIDGKWSFSALVYFFKSGGKFNKAVFGDYQNKTLSGLECMLRFRTSSDANKRFNFFFGTNYGFSKDAPNYGKWDFRMGIGN